MPNVVGMGLSQATAVLIAAGIVPNDGMVSASQVPASQNLGYFDPWPIGIKWAPAGSAGTVTAQYPPAGAYITVSQQLTTPQIALKVGSFPMGVSNMYSAGAYDSNMVDQLFVRASGIVGVGVVGSMVVGYSA